MFEQKCINCGILFRSTETMNFCSGICRMEYDEYRDKGSDLDIISRKEFLSSRMTPVELQQYYMLLDQTVDVTICENGWARIECLAANAMFEEQLEIQRYE